MSWQGGLISGLGDLLGGGINAIIQDKTNKKNYEMQKEFAQNSLQWKVEDAKKAGLHPLAAINAQTYAPTPSYVGSDVGSGVSGAFKGMGQAVSGYLDDKMSLDSEKDMLDIQRMKLENAKLEKELKSMGQGFGGVVKNALGTPNEEFQKSFKNDAVNQLVPKGDGTYHLGWSPESNQGQHMSEGNVGWLMGNFTGLGNFYLNSALRKNLRKQAIKAGVLKPDEDWNFEWNGYGYTLVPEKVYNRERKKSPPPHKYKSQMLGY